MPNNPLTQNVVEQIFIKGGCIFNDIYIVSKKKYNYICSCGEHSQIYLYKFIKGQRCFKCLKQKRYITVKTFFKDNGCDLISTEYINNNSNLIFRCKCGNLSKITFSNFQKKKCCRECGFKNGCEKRKLTFEYVFNYFKQHGCELLDTEYINAQTKLKFRCICGNIHYMRFVAFKKGHRCNKCGNEKIRNYQVKKYIKFRHINKNRISLLFRIRKRFSRQWSLLNMTNDPNYEDFKLNPTKYETDHIIPIALFRNLIIEYNLNEQSVREVINQKNNLQLLTTKENSKKRASGCINEAKRYLIENGINLEDALVREYVNSQ